MKYFTKTQKALNYVKQLDSVSYQEFVDDFPRYVINDPNHPYWNTKKAKEFSDDLIDFIIDIISKYDHEDSWLSINIEDKNSLLFLYYEAVLFKKNDEELNKILNKIIDNINKNT